MPDPYVDLYYFLYLDEGSYQCNDPIQLRVPNHRKLKKKAKILGIIELNLFIDGG